MKISTMGRHLREGAKNVIRNGWMSFASISSIAISLFILGAFLLLALNVDKLAGDAESEVEIQVYLDVGLTETQVRQIQNEIASLPEVNQIRFVSKEEGLELVKEKFGEDFADVLAGLEGDENPLPDSLVVKVHEPQQVGEVARQIQDRFKTRDPQPILDVEYGEGAVETLFKFTNAIRTVGLVLVAGLAFTAIFLISNTIKLTILARRREIAIMKLVGATNSFIRWPFFVEGALLGVIGSAIPVAVLLYGYDSLVKQTQLELGLLMMRLLTLEEIGWKIAGLLFGIGIVIGIWGSVISVRKFLKV